MNSKRIISLNESINNIIREESDATKGYTHVRGGEGNLYVKGEMDPEKAQKQANEKGADAKLQNGKLVPLSTAEKQPQDKDAHGDSTKQQTTKKPTAKKTVKVVDKSELPQKDNNQGASSEDQTNNKKRATDLVDKINRSKLDDRNKKIQHLKLKDAIDLISNGDEKSMRIADYILSGIEDYVNNAGGMGVQNKNANVAQNKDTPMDNAKSNHQQLSREIEHAFESFDEGSPEYEELSAMQDEMDKLSGELSDATVGRINKDLEGIQRRLDNLGNTKPAGKEDPTSGNKTNDAEPNHKEVSGENSATVYDIIERKYGHNKNSRPEWWEKVTNNARMYEKERAEQSKGKTVVEALPYGDSIRELYVDGEGLSKEQAEEKLRMYGPDYVFQDGKMQKVDGLSPSGIGISRSTIINRITRKMKPLQSNSSDAGFFIDENGNVVHVDFKRADEDFEENGVMKSYKPKITKFKYKPIDISKEENKKMVNDAISKQIESFNNFMNSMSKASSSKRMYGVFDIAKKMEQIREALENSKHSDNENNVAGFAVEAAKQAKKELEKIKIEIFSTGSTKRDNLLPFIEAISKEMVSLDPELTKDMEGTVKKVYSLNPKSPKQKTEIEQIKNDLVMKYRKMVKK